MDNSSVAFAYCDWQRPWRRRLSRRRWLRPHWLVGLATPRLPRPLTKYRLASVITLLDPDSGETLPIKGLGFGQDAGDKAVAKAQTMAIKYAYLNSLAIATNDDPEAD
ncbi:MAG: hypothetical protein IJQ82_12060 [Selenomonadaceae bacterium]|nr:hypothetical protein [Selenomonadaceae bacterium]